MTIYIPALERQATVHDVIDGLWYWCCLSDGESWAQVPIAEAETLH